ncbi:hypothetical protein SDC9_178681 [bioreactor metagenome]|uniref:Uncharacterized protein n=1 Tax=bioreactor metagenome TaxID=1076179 RepID=A0A645GWX2_9ZZZZ
MAQGGFQFAGVFPPGAEAGDDALGAAGGERRGGQKPGLAMVETIEQRVGRDRLASRAGRRVVALDEIGGMAVAVVEQGVDEIVAGQRHGGLLGGFGRY